MTGIYIPVGDPQDRRRVFLAIRSRANAIGMGLVKETQLITAVSELVNNMLKYAGEGLICIEVNPEKDKIVVIATDQGPGIADIRMAMTRGYSTGNTLGVGLPGAKNLVDEFNLESQVGVGTAVRIGKYV